MSTKQQPHVEDSTAVVVECLGFMLPLRPLMAVDRRWVKYSVALEQRPSASRMLTTDMASDT